MPAGATLRADLRGPGIPTLRDRERITVPDLWKCGALLDTNLAALAVNSLLSHFLLFSDLVVWVSLQNIIL